MTKLENLSLVEEVIFKFHRRSFRTPPKQIGREFEKLLENLKKQERNRFETRAFVYLDIISWLESKIQGVPVATVIRKKFLERRKKKNVESA